MEGAVAVDHQPRIGLQDRVRIEFLGHEAHHRLDADIPGDVPAQFAFRYAEVAQLFGMRRPAWSLTSRKGDGLAAAT